MSAEPCTFAEELEPALSDAEPVEPEDPDEPLEPSEPADPDDAIPAFAEPEFGSVDPDVIAEEPMLPMST